MRNEHVHSNDYLIYTDSFHMELLGILDPKLELIQTCPGTTHEWLGGMLDRMADGVYTKKAAALSVLRGDETMTLGELLVPVGSKPVVTKRKTSSLTRTRHTAAWWLSQTPLIRDLRDRGRDFDHIASELGVTRRLLDVNVVRHSLLTGL